MSAQGKPPCINQCLRRRSTLWKDCPTFEYICACSSSDRAYAFLNSEVGCFQKCPKREQDDFVLIVRLLAIDCGNKPDGGILKQIAPNNPYSKQMMEPVRTSRMSLTTSIPQPTATSDDDITTTSTMAPSTPLSSLTPTSELASSSSSLPTIPTIPTTSPSPTPSQTLTKLFDPNNHSSVVIPMTLAFAPLILLIIGSTLYIFISTRRENERRWREEHAVPPTRPLSPQTTPRAVRATSDFPAGEARKSRLRVVPGRWDGVEVVGREEERRKQEQRVVEGESEWDAWDRYIETLERE